MVVAVAATVAAAAAEDPRVRIDLPPDVREVFLEHMRTHMTSLDGVLQLVAAGRIKEAGTLARKEMAIGQGLGIGSHMPREFREMGFEFHRAADDFARVTAAVSDPPDQEGWKALVKGLAGITMQCNGCHGAYRVR
jgi:hypothetical protein